MPHCHLCLKSIDDDEPPIPAIPMHPECHEHLRIAPLDYRTEWVQLYTEGLITKTIAQTESLEHQLDANEFTLYGQNSRHMPREMEEAVTRLIYAVSLADAGILPPDAAPTIAAIAWHADHETREVSLTDEELQRYTEAITPVIQKSLGRSRFLQAHYFRQFLRDQAGTRPILEAVIQRLREQDQAQP